MTKHECVIVSAYTGVNMVEGDDLKLLYDYIEKKLGKKIWTHELASPAMQFKIQRACKDDFIKLCSEATD